MKKEKETSIKLSCEISLRNSNMCVEKCFVLEGYLRHTLSLKLLNKLLRQENSFKTNEKWMK